ncbi:hypothetical protein, partial [Methanolobus sp.]|uniref:hypothetical protein n=1 Tax=Methanolobus sp. TaxID=1874737 RepID=UPI0025E03671
MRPFAKNVTMSSIQGIVKISFCIALLVLAVTLSAAGGSSSGNSTESASYNITIADVINGTANITIDKPTAAVNETVIVTITDIESGKEFVSIDVDGNSGPVSVTEIIAGANYTFQMPAENVTVTVALENIPPVTVTGISINAAPSKVTYTEGDALDLNGLVIRLARSNSTTEDVAFADFISEGITADPANGSILATTNTSVTITHTESGETAIQAITVNAVPVTVTGISINAAPSKVTY